MANKAKSSWFLKEWRKHRGYTQERLAEMTGLSTPYVSQLEKGRRQYTQELLELFAEALQCDLSDLIRRRPEDAEGIEILDSLNPQQKRQIIAIAETLRRTGTED